MRRVPLTCAVVLAGILVTACGSGGDTSGAAPAEGDACLGTIPSGGAECALSGGGQSVLTIDALDGDVPPKFRAGTFACSTSASKITTYYPNVSGDPPLTCDADWSLSMRIHEGDAATQLTPTPKGSIVVEVPSGSLVLALDTGLKAGRCTAPGTASYALSGAGSITLERVIVPKTTTTCAHYRFTNVELTHTSSGAPPSSFRFSGTLKTRGLPLAP